MEKIRWMQKSLIGLNLPTRRLNVLSLSLRLNGKNQIPPDLVVKSQAIDMAEIILSRIRRPNAVQTLCRNRISRFEQLSTSEAHWSTTKFDGMWKKVMGFPANSRATMSLPALFLLPPSTDVHRGPDVFPMVIPPRMGQILRSPRMAQTQVIMTRAAVPQGPVVHTDDTG
jgi:hypothetical protein